MLLAKLGLVLLSLLTGLGMIEGGLRLFAPQALYAVEYCALGWCHVPGASFTRGGETGEFVVSVRYNSRGLRDREFALEKPAGTRRVQLFGDSYTEGLEVEQDEVIAKRLERRLRERLGPGVEVMNFGVSAYDTAQEWQYFRTEGVRYQPDLAVVIWTGESGSPYARVVDGRVAFVEPRYTESEQAVRRAKTFFKRHLHTVSFAFSRLGLNRSLREFHGTRADVVPAGHAIQRGTLPALPFPPAWEMQVRIFEQWLADARRHGAALIVAAHSTAAHEYLRESLRLRPIPGLITVDLQQVSDAEEATYHFPLDGHWTPAGHDKAARILAGEILKAELLRP